MFNRYYWERSKCVAFALRLSVGNGLDRSVNFGCWGVFCENGKPFVGKPTFPLSREYNVRPRTAARAVPTIQCRNAHIFKRYIQQKQSALQAFPLRGRWRRSRRMRCSRKAAWKRRICRNVSTSSVTS